MPEAARVRSVSLRPRGPLPLHFRKHPREGVPGERDFTLVPENVTYVNINVTTIQRFYIQLKQRFSFGIIRGYERINAPFSAVEVRLTCETSNGARH